MKKNSRDSRILTMLNDFMEQKIFNAPLLDRMLGAYVFFEFDGRACTKYQASDAYLDMTRQMEKTDEYRQDLFACVHESEKVYIRRSLRFCMEKDTLPYPVKELNYRYVFSNGKELWVSMEAYLLFKKQTSAVFCGILHDITEQKILREQLSTTVEAFCIASRETENLVFTYNMRTRTMAMEQESAELFGIQPIQSGVPYSVIKNTDMIAEDSKGEYIRIHQEMLDGKKEAEGIVKVKMADGQQNVYRLKMQAVLDMEGKRTETAVGIYNDITAQYIKAMEQERSLQSLQREIAQKEENAKAESRKQLDMIYALSLDYHTIYLINLEEGTFTVQRKTDGIDTDALDQIQKADYSESMEEYICKYVHPQDRAFVQKEISIENIKRRFLQEKEFTIRYRRTYQGKMEYIEWRAVNVRGRLGESEALIAIRNVDEQVKQEIRQKELLEDALKQAQKASVAKTIFLSNMSNDIRTPMNAIIGFSTIAANHMDDREHVLDCLNKIKSSGNHLLNLIDDILDMSRVESGKMTLNETSCRLGDILEELQNIIQPQIAAKGLEFHMDMENITKQPICCDKLRLFQILLNLFSNAIKFTESGGAIFFCIRQQEKKNEGMMSYEFRIRDNGIGMSREFQTHLFEAFERERTDNAIQGTGLGMAITKCIVDMMGGTIKVDSEPGRGTEFVIELDIRMCQEGRENVSAGGIPDMEASMELFQGKRVLLVEDNRLNREIAKELLGDVGFLIEEAVNGRDALERIKQAASGYYDLVLMDIQMPVMNGYEAAQAIRTLGHKEKAQIPIVAMTANAFETDKEQAIRSGMDAHVPKPVHMEELLGIVHRLLNRKKGEKQG